MSSPSPPPTNPIFSLCENFLPFPQCSSQAKYFLCKIVLVLFPVLSLNIFLFTPKPALLYVTLAGIQYNQYKYVCVVRIDKV